MAEIEIRFRMNLKTGKKDIIIDVESDDDAMRHEHERDHRRIVERLIGQGLIEAGELGEITIERAAPGLPVDSPEARPQDGKTQSNPG